MNLIFDLDGTLTDPESGITRSMAHALERLGFAVPDRVHLRRYIGPPLRAVFGELLATSDAVLIEHAVAVYRERFGDVGLYENELYPETVESLERLAGSGHQLFVATHEGRSLRAANRGALGALAALRGGIWGRAIGRGLAQGGAVSAPRCGARDRPGGVGHDRRPGR